MRITSNGRAKTHSNQLSITTSMKTLKSCKFRKSRLRSSKGSSRVLDPNRSVLAKGAHPWTLPAEKAPTKRKIRLRSNKNSRNLRGIFLEPLGNLKKKWSWLLVMTIDLQILSLTKKLTKQENKSKNTRRGMLSRRRRRKKNIGSENKKSRNS